MKPLRTLRLKLDTAITSCFLGIYHLQVFVPRLGFGSLVTFVSNGVPY